MHRTTLSILVVSSLAFSVAGAQARGTTARPGTAVRVGPAADAYSIIRAGDRPALGLSTSSGGMRDTLGLLISGVTAGGPAEKAGLEEGARIVAINGVNLRLSADDAKEPDMAMVLSRRFQRELDKVNAGEEVDLRVYADGQTRNLKVKAVRADELRSVNRASVAGRLDERPTIGASVGGYPSVRDTLGVFIAAVAEDGPLAKAGIFEGSRIASINGVDLRVPVADAGDEFMTSARVRRLTREVEKLEAGGKADLRVYTNGQYRNVSVNTVKRSDLKQNPGVSIFHSDGVGGILLRARSGDGTELMLERLRMDMNHLQNDARREIEAVIRAREHLMRDTLRLQLEGLREAEDAARRAEEAARRKIEEAARAIRGTVGTTASYAPAVGVSAGSPYGLLQPAVRTTATAYRNETTPQQGAAFTVGGVRLSRVDAQLARYLGAGTENGLLVLELEPRWSGIRAGDVLLSIDGRAVRIGDSSRVALDNARPQQVDLIREGKRLTVTLTGR